MTKLYLLGVRKALEKLGTFSFADNDPEGWARIQRGAMPEHEMFGKLNFNPRAPRPAAMPHPQTMGVSKTLSADQLSNMSSEQMYSHFGLKPRTAAGGTVSMRTPMPNMAAQAAEHAEPALARGAESAAGHFMPTVMTKLKGLLGHM